MYPDGDQMIRDYLIRQEVIFICGRCGHTVVMNVPSEEDENIKSYCCAATHKIKRYKNGDFSIFRVADQVESKTMIGEADIPMQEGK